MTIKQQSGFGVVPIIVIIAAVVVLGFVGYKVYEAQSKKQATNSVTMNKQSSPASSQPSSTQTSTPPAPADTYLDIKELGIKIKLSDSIKDATYALRQPQPTDDSKVVGISAQSLIDSAAKEKLDCNPASSGIGLIRATTTAPTYIGEDRPLPVDNKTLFKFSNTYYQYIPPQQVCGIGDADHQTLLDLATQKQTAFAEAFKTVQLDN